MTQRAFKRLFLVALLLLNALLAQRSLAQVIGSFTPTTINAGKGDVLTINGSGFGTSGPNTTRYVSFTGASVGIPFVVPLASDYVSWTDTKIMVKVPTDAGSGIIKVTNGTTITSSSSLTIFYNLLDVSYNNVSYVPVLVNKNTKGGSTFNLNTTFNANTNAAQSFTRALETWECTTTVNWTIGSTTTVNTVANDGINVIAFASNGDLDAGLLGQTHNYYSSTDSKRWEVIGTDIIFAAASTYNWNFLPALPGPLQYDFFTVALHELGHAHQLGHVNDGLDVMHATTASGFRTNLNVNNKAAANYIMSLSTANATSFISPPMVPAAACTVSISNDAALSALALNTGTLSPAFAKTTMTYTATVPYSTTGISVKPTAENAGTTININYTIVPTGTFSKTFPLQVGSNMLTIITLAQDGLTTETYTINVVRGASPNANLTGLTVSEGVLSPVFATNTISYADSVNNTFTSVTLTPKLSDSTAKVTVNGAATANNTASVPVSLNVGNNSIPVVVTAPDGTTTKTYTVVVNRAIPDIYKLPADNFKLSVTSATCKGSNNGSITITAANALNYTVTVTGGAVNSSYPFTTSQTVGTLSAGSYSVCVYVTGQPDYQQCFDAVITEPADLSAYSVVNPSDNTVTLALGGGDLYNITLNGTNYTTTQNSVTLPLKYGDNDLKITTDKLCQGTIQRTINIEPTIVAYPVPFQNTLNISLGAQNINNVSVAIRGINDGRLVYANQYLNQAGLLQLDLTNLSGGVYALYITMGNSEKVIKILKQ